MNGPRDEDDHHSADEAALREVEAMPEGYGRDEYEAESKAQP